MTFHNIFDLMSENKKNNNIYVLWTRVTGGQKEDFHLTELAALKLQILTLTKFQIQNFFCSSYRTPLGKLETQHNFLLGSALDLPEMKKVPKRVIFASNFQGVSTTQFF